MQVIDHLIILRLVLLLLARASLMQQSNRPKQAYSQAFYSRQIGLGQVGPLVRLLLQANRPGQVGLLMSLLLRLGKDAR